jgi:WD40 repeat protein
VAAVFWISKQIRLQAAQVTEPVRTLGYGSLDTMTASPDGRFILTGGGMGAYLWDVNTGKVVQSFRPTTGAVVSVAFAPDGARMITGSNDGNVDLWATTSGEHLAAFQSGDGPIAAVFSANGERLLILPLCCGVELWDTTQGVQPVMLRRLSAAGGHVSGTFSADGGQILTADFNNGAWLWNVSTGATVRRYGHSAAGSAIFSPDGSAVLVGERGSAALYEGTTGELVARFDMNVGGHFVRASFSPDGSRVLSSCYDSSCEVWMWDRWTGAHLRTFEGSDRPAAFMPDGLRVLTGGPDATVRFWVADTGELSQTLSGHLYEQIHSAVSTRDGRTLVTSGTSVSSDRCVRRWSLPDGALEWTAAVGLGGRNPWEPLVVVELSPDGHQILAWERGAGLVSILDSATGMTQVPFRSERHTLLAATFLPDGHQVATLGHVSEEPYGQTGILEMVFFDTGTGVALRTFEIGRFPPLSVHYNQCYLAALSDGQGLVAGLSYLDGTFVVQAWDVHGSEPLWSHSGEGNLSALAAANKEGQVLVVAYTLEPVASKSTATLLNVGTGETVWSIPEELKVWFRAGSLSLDGRFALLAGASRSPLRPYATLWDLVERQSLRTFTPALHDDSDSWFAATAFTPTGHAITSWAGHGGSNGIAIWDIRDVMARPRFSLAANGSEIHWDLGTLQFAPSLHGLWTDLPAASPFPLSPIGDRGFFRVKMKE